VRGHRHIDLRPWLRGFLRGLAGAAVLVTAYAEDTPAPEEPDWNQRSPAVESPSDTASQAASIPTPSETAAPGTSGAISNSNPASQPDPASLAAAEARDTAGGGQLTETAEVGVPNGNFNLPTFNFYGKPFFERQGLRLRIGPVHFRMSLSLGEEYNTNILGTHTNPEADYITHIAPEFLIGMGDFRDQAEDYLLFQYRPSFDYYLKNSDQNRVNETLDLSARATLSRYTTKLELNYVNSDQPNATQSGGQSYQNTEISWDNSYYLGAKAFARAIVDALDQQSENENNYQTISLAPQLGYEYSPKTTIFAGPYAGIAYIGEGGTQTFQGITAGFVWSNLRKLKIEGTGGVQARQFHGSNVTGASNFMTPIYDLKLTYEARANTTVTIEFLRNVQISDILRGLTYTNTQANLGLTQKLLNRFNLTLGLSYQTLEYQGTDAGVFSIQGHKENYVVFNASLSYPFWKDLMSASVFYRYQERTSNLDVFNYTITAYGFGFTYAF
jgi:hypothetical protein